MAKGKELYKLCEKYTELYSKRPPNSDKEAYYEWNILMKPIREAIGKYIYELHGIASYLDVVGNVLYVLHGHESIIIVEPYNDDYVLNIGTH